MEKLLPQNIEAECGVLGSIIIDPEAIVDLAPFLHPEDFYRDAHRTIYEVILHLSRRGGPADFITICDELERRTLLDDVGGASSISALINQVPTSGNVEYYGHIVARTAQMRRLIKAAGEIAALAYSDAEDALPQAEEKILAVGKQGAFADLRPLGDLLPTYLAELERRESGIRGISTGFRGFDIPTRGFQRGKLYVVGARPGVGKTTFCQNVAYRGALKGHRYAYFSLEMPEDDVLDCFMAMDSLENSLRLQGGDIEDWSAVVESGDRLAELGMYLRYTPGIYLDELASMARRIVHAKNVEMIIIDYLQLMRARIDGKRIQHREMEIAEIARGLKALAGELRVPILVPAQINRNVERASAVCDERMNLSFRMPSLADLRESGEIEQSADTVIVAARSEEDETKVRFQFVKNRRGPLGSVDLHFEGGTSRFLSIEIERDEYGNIIDLEERRHR